MPNKIIKIHGCSGAGKTTAVRDLMSWLVVDPVHNGDKIEAYTDATLLDPDDTPVFVLGSYENNCGGMDTVGTAQQVCDLVAKYYRQGHVIHEGLLQSTYYGAMGKDSVQYGDNYIYAFLNTPLDVCLKRVVERRERNGSKNKFNPALTEDKFHTINALREKLPRFGHRVAVLQWDQPMAPQLLELLA